MSSTAGWSKGLICIAMPNKIVSRIKNVKSSPKVSSFLLSTTKLLNGKFFFLKTFSVAHN